MGYDCPYRGESLASYTHQVVLALIKNKRKKHSNNDRDRILAATGNRCQECGDPGNTWDNVLQIDHPLPLRDFGDNEQEYNVLCHQCHGHKSYLEALTPFQENPLASVFEPSIYESFVQSPKAKQAVQQLHVPKNQTPAEIDVRRCRRSALEQNQYPLPVFSLTDEIKPMQARTGRLQLREQTSDLDVCQVRADDARYMSEVVLARIGRVHAAGPHHHVG